MPIAITRTAKIHALACWLETIVSSTLSSLGNLCWTDPSTPADVSQRQFAFYSLVTHFPLNINNIRRGVSEKALNFHLTFSYGNIGVQDSSLRFKQRGSNAKIYEWM